MNAQSSHARMRAIPIELKSANAFISAHHRHHAPVYRDKWRVGCIDNAENMIGVIQAGRPVSRYLDDGKTIEVVRCCSCGQRNVCSFLYSRAARIAKEMGYRRIITYILEIENGASLKACGWTLDEHDCGGGEWNCKSRPRETVEYNLFGEQIKYPTGKKQRWSKDL